LHIPTSKKQSVGFTRFKRAFFATGNEGNQKKKYFERVLEKIIHACREGLTRRQRSGTTGFGSGQPFERLRSIDDERLELADHAPMLVA
jgi:hypothetical protein